MTEQQRAVGDRNVQGYSGEHGLDVRGHIIRPFAVMEPGLIGRREAVERGRKIGAHSGIGIFLNDQRG